MHAFEAAQALRALLEDGIAGDLRLRRQQRIEQPDLRLPNLILSPSASPMPASKPYFLSHSSGTTPNVPSSSRTVVAALQRLDQFRQRDLLLAEFGGAVKLEPVDVGSELDAEVAGLAVEPPSASTCQFSLMSVRITAGSWVAGISSFGTSCGG